MCDVSSSRMIGVLTEDQSFLEGTHIFPLLSCCCWGEGEGNTHSPFPFVFSRCRLCAMDQILAGILLRIFLSLNFLHTFKPLRVPADSRLSWFSPAHLQLWAEHSSLRLSTSRNTGCPSTEFRGLSLLASCLKVPTQQSANPSSESQL